MIDAAPRGSALDARLTRADGVIGAFAAGVIGVLWLGLLVFSLSFEWSGTRWAFAPLVVIAQTFLYTGLFITAHDAMHRTACWTHQGLNDAIGRVALALYALFSFERLLAKHREHHEHPGSHEDPDYHDGERVGFFGWYMTFLLRYLSVWQLVGMAIIFNILAHLVGVGEPELLLFWVIPSLVSTLQLFFFGTYLPHRQGEHAWADEHRARSNDMPPWLSFLTCYHFGYHLEHHRFPHVPWWMLPRVRAAQLQGDS